MWAYEKILGFRMYQKLVFFVCLFVFGIYIYFLLETIHNKSS